MITVVGEALIGLIVDPVGHVDPRVGGGPFNVTRAVVRLGLVRAENLIHVIRPGHHPPRKRASAREIVCRSNIELHGLSWGHVAW
jgi:hypothetical protein